MTFKDMLVFLRHQEGLTQEELASRLGVSRSTIGMYERGKREPDLKTLEKIADIFGVDMNYILNHPVTEAAVMTDAAASEYQAKFSSLDRMDQIKAMGYIEGLLSEDKYALAGS